MPIISPSVKITCCFSMGFGVIFFGVLILILCKMHVLQILRVFFVAEMAGWVGLKRLPRDFLRLYRWMHFTADLVDLLIWGGTPYITGPRMCLFSVLVFFCGGVQGTLCQRKLPEATTEQNTWEFVAPFQPLPITWIAVMAFTSYKYL